MNNTAKFLIGLLALLLLLWFVQGAFATARVDKIYWCHTEPNGNQQTLHLPLPALTNAGHVDAQGNALHAGDHAGACVDPTNTPVPTEMPDYCEEEGYQPYGPCEAEITPSPEVTPEVTQAPVVHQPKMADATTPSCPDLTPTSVNDMWVERGTANDGALNVHWGTNSNYGRVHIRYSEIDGEWRYALLNSENDGMEEIRGLKNGVHYFFQVAYVNGCAVGPYSHSYDPLP